MPSLLFRRFVDDIRFIEIAIDGTQVWSRGGYTQLEAKLTLFDFESPQAAQEHYAAKIAKYEKEYEDDGTVLRSVPHADAKPVKPALRWARSEALIPLRATYRRMLGEANLELQKPFVQQVRKDATSDDVARECLAIAEKAFGVEFARAWSNGTDEIDLRDDEFATFYESPMKVQRIAEKRVLGRLTLDDGPR